MIISLIPAASLKSRDHSWFIVPKPTPLPYTISSPASLYVEHRLYLVLQWKFRNSVTNWSSYNDSGADRTLIPFVVTQGFLLVQMAFFLIHFSPVLLRCNWYITLCKSKVYNLMILYMYALQNDYQNKFS